jgi:C-methyltransferase
MTANWTEATHAEEAPPPSAHPAADAAAKARQMAAAHWSAAIIQAAVQLQIVDAVDTARPTSLDTIAQRTGCPPARVLRLMRALVAMGFFAHIGGKRYVHTDLSRSLLADTPFSVRNLVLLGASAWNWVAWSGLSDSVRDGEPAFTHHYGKSLYEYFAQDNPEAGAVFNRSMSESGKWTTPAIVEALDVNGITEVADIGGGQGGLLAAVLDRHPQLRGTLVDNTSVIEQADPRLRGGPLAARCSLVGADIRQSVPVTAELFLLRQVMHIWDDETCTRLLSNCITGCPAGTRVILIEHLLTDDAAADPPNPVFSTQIDLLMMLIGSGQERTLADFQSVFEQAGLKFSRVQPTRTPFALIEGVVPG